ncbi:unnamed protein product [Natator depressus]
MGCTALQQGESAFDVSDEGGGGDPELPATPTASPVRAAPPSKPGPFSSALPAPGQSPPAGIRTPACV